jgi:aryl-alcohol dehydrogenase-like predicted oxidoreductase
MLAGGAAKPLLVPQRRTTMTLPRRRLGRSNVWVSELGLGGYQFTNELGVPRAVARAILQRAFAAGINYVDTAPLYGSGESEELIGRERGDAPNQIIVSTKIGHLDRTIVRSAGEGAYRDEDLLRRVFEHSLHLLRCDCVEILLIHEPDWPAWGIDRKTGEAPVVRALEAFKREGLARAIGIGGWKDCELQADLLATGRFDVLMTLMHYDLAVQDGKQRLLAVARQEDVGVIIAGPFRQGALAARRPAAVAEMKHTGRYQHGFNADVLRRIDALYALSDDTDLDLPELALRYLLSDPEIASIIPGPRSVAELDANVAASKRGQLPFETLARIDEIGRM